MRDMRWSTNTSAITPGNVNVFRLHNPPVNGSSGIPVGALTLGYNVGGSAVAPNGRYFYATSERYTASGVRENITEPCSDLDPGFFSVIDLHQLETDPSTANHVDIPAGYHQSVSGLRWMGRTYGLLRVRVMPYWHSTQRNSHPPPKDRQIQPLLFLLLCKSVARQ
jgi:hypothetical protein